MEVDKQQGQKRGLDDEATGCGIDTKTLALLEEVDENAADKLEAFQKFQYADTT